jgi:hypothetical protein
MMAYALTFDELADRVMRITHGIKAECLHYLYEAQRDFVLKAPVIQKIWTKQVLSTEGVITAVVDATNFAKFTVTSETATSGTLKRGRKYTLTTFVAGDDFTNVAAVVSGTINVTGCVFIASGATPTTWTEGSTITKWTGLAVDDHIQVHGTALHNGLQKVSAVTIDTVTTDHAFVYAEANLTAAFQYGFLFDFPSDYVDWQRVEWRGCKMRPSHQNDLDYMAQTDGFQLLTGSAYTFWVEGSRLRLVPAPSDDSAIVMAYTYYDTTDAPTSPILPPIYHQYLMDYAIATMLEVAGDENRANKYWQKYQLALDNVNANRVMSLLS